MVKGKSFYCRCEGEAEGEGSRLNVASRLDLAVREAGMGGWSREGDRTENEQLWGGKPVNWWVWSRRGESGW